MTVIKLKLLCKVVTNQSATEKLKKFINVPVIYQYGTNKAINSASGLKDSGKNKT